MLNYKFENHIEMKKSSSIRELKKNISDYLQINFDDFLIKRNSHNGDELNILSDSLYKFDTNNINIYVEFGRPLGECKFSYNLDELNVSVFLWEYDFSKFMIYPYKISDCGIFFVNTKLTIRELKILLCNDLKRTRNIELKSDHVIIREFLYDKASKVFSVYERYTLKMN